MTAADGLPVWLIERGQPEGQAPTIWWRGKERSGIPYMGLWTETAHEAMAFSSKETAEAFIAGHYMRLCRATEHVLINRADGLPEPTMPKFAKTFCSQCGQEFGPGDHGFSHCSEHQGRIIYSDGTMSVKTPNAVAGSGEQDQLPPMPRFVSDEHDARYEFSVPRTTYEDLRDEYVDLHQVAERLVAENASLRVRNFNLYREVAELRLDEAELRRLRKVAGQDIHEVFERAELAESRLRAAEKLPELLETVPYPEPPAYVHWHEDYLTGCTAYRDALKTAIDKARGR